MTCLCLFTANNYEYGGLSQNPVHCQFYGIYISFVSLHLLENLILWTFQSFKTQKVLCFSNALDFRKLNKLVWKNHLAGEMNMALSVCYYRCLHSYADWNFGKFGAPFSGNYMFQFEMETNIAARYCVGFFCASSSP